MNEKRVFISYGHDKYSMVVERFADEISSIFADVFFDAKSLNVGERYDNKIEEAIEQCDIVVFFMTKYSVRINNNGLTNADDSFCRDEIEYARSCKKSIIPVMLEDCQPPLIVHRLQYINGKKVFHGESLVDEQEYIKTKNNILATIDDINALAQYGESYSLMQVLNQFDNDAYSKGLTKDFTGRKWLSQKCLSWIKEANEKVFCIFGEIGSGKSSFITNLVFDDVDGYFAGIHYCRFDIESSTKVRNIVKSLTYSVATQITGFSQYIEGISERVLDTASGIELFEKLLVEPLNRISNHGRKAVVIIDAIDEISDLGEREEFLGIISDNARLLPDWFKIIITSRPDSKLEYLLQGTTVIKIDTSSDENIKDISDYIDGFLAIHSLTISDEDKNDLIIGSGGNFLYVYFALSDLLEGGSFGTHNKKYPKGLDGIYARTINRKFKNIDEYESEIVPIFEILCATKAPISIDDLSKVLGEGKRSLLSKIQRVSAFIRKDNNTLYFYHKSLAEWLVNWDKSGEYYIESGEGEKKIIKWIKNPDNEFTASDYCMSYGVSHLVENKEYNFLNQFLQDKQFIIAEKYSTVLLEYVYRKQFDVVRQVIISICTQPSVVSFVVIRRVVDGAINAGEFDSAICVNELQRDIEKYKVFYYSGLGNILLYRSKDIDSAKEIYMEGMTLAEIRYSEDQSAWNQFALSVCNGRMGKIMVESMKMDEAMNYYRCYLDLSLDLYRETELVEVLRNVAIGYERIGWIQQSKKDYKDALKQYDQCLTESQKIYDETKTIEALRGVAITYERLGRIAEIQGDFEKAVEYYMHNYTMSSEIYNQMGALNSKRGLANSCHCLGDAFIGQHKFTDALSWFQKDRQISSEIYSVTDMIDDIRDYAICLDRLAYTSDKLGKVDEAERLFCESVGLYSNLVERVRTKKLINEFLVECIRITEFYQIYDLKDKAESVIRKAESIINVLDMTDEVSVYWTKLLIVKGETTIKEYSSLCNRRDTK